MASSTTPATGSAASDEIVVRPFQSEDLPQVVQLFREGLMSYPEHQEHIDLLEQVIAENVKADLSDIEGTYMAPGGNFWVATPKAEPSLVVGMVGLEVKPEQEGELRRMSVKESHRRNGIGRLLVSALENWAAEKDVQKIWFTTGGTMDKAHRFYKSVGYLHTDTFVVSEDPHFVAFRFEKCLNDTKGGTTTASSESVAPPTSPTQVMSVPEIVIRQYQVEDWSQMAELFREGMLHYPDNQNNPLVDQFIDTALKTGDLKDVQATYMAPGGNFWVVTPLKDPSLVVAIVGLEAKPDGEGELRHMSVRDGYRRVGIGQRLVAELEQWAEKQQFRKISLTTSAAMDKARAFYLSMGYEHTDTFVVSEDPYIEIVKYQKSLGKSASMPDTEEEAA